MPSSPALTPEEPRLPTPVAEHDPAPDTVNCVQIKLDAKGNITIDDLVLTMPELAAHLAASKLNGKQNIVMLKAEPGLSYKDYYLTLTTVADAGYVVAIEE